VEYERGFKTPHKEKGTEGYNYKYFKRLEKLQEEKNLKRKGNLQPCRRVNRSAMKGTRRSRKKKSGLYLLEERNRTTKKEAFFIAHRTKVRRQKTLWQQSRTKEKGGGPLSKKRVPQIIDKGDHPFEKSSTEKKATKNSHCVGLLGKTIANKRVPPNCSATRSQQKNIPREVKRSGGGGGGGSGTCSFTCVSGTKWLFGEKPGEGGIFAEKFFSPEGELGPVGRPCPSASVRKFSCRKKKKRSWMMKRGKRK